MLQFIVTFEPHREVGHELACATAEATYTKFETITIQPTSAVWQLICVFVFRNFYDQASLVLHT